MSTNQSKKRKSENLAGGKQSYEELEEELLLAKKKLAEVEEENKRLKEEATTKNKDDDDVSDDEYDHLASLDMNDTWNVRYVELREYLKMHGDCKVPFKYAENPKLGMWVFNQRKNYSKVKEGKKCISQERIALLDGLGFNWGKKFPAPALWDDRFEELKKYMQAYGKMPVHSSNPSPLAMWAANQRAEYKRGKKGQDSLLSFDQIEKLNNIGFKW